MKTVYFLFHKMIIFCRVIKCDGVSLIRKIKVFMYLSFRLFRQFSFKVRIAKGLLMSVYAMARSYPIIYGYTQTYDCAIIIYILVYLFFSFTN